MSLDFDERIRVGKIVVPLLVPYLRRLRANGSSDPRADAKAAYDSDPLTQTRTLAEISPLLAVAGIAVADFNLWVDAAMLQM
jgi:hypothetical protein